MERIFSNIEDLQEELKILVDRKKEVIKYIKENVYSSHLYSNDGKISDSQIAKACVLLYENKTFQSYLAKYSFPNKARNYCNKENGLEYFDFFEINDFDSDYESRRYYNYVFNIKSVKQFFRDEKDYKNAWIDAVKNKETILGYKEYKDSLLNKPDEEFLRLIEKHSDYQIIKIDCKELKIKDWFYAIHKSNYIKL